MTYREANLAAREKHILIDDLNILTHNRLDNLAIAVARRISSELNFPRTYYNGSIGLTGELNLGVAVNRVVDGTMDVNGVPLELGDLAEVNMLRRLQGVVQKYFYDTSENPVTIIRVGPLPTKVMPMRFEYVYFPPATATSQVWNGVHASFHDLVVYGIAIEYFKAGGDEGEAAAMLQPEYDRLYNSLAATVYKLNPLQQAYTQERGSQS